MLQSFLIHQTQRRQGLLPDWTDSMLVHTHSGNFVVEAPTRFCTISAVASRRWPLSSGRVHVGGRSHRRDLVPPHLEGSRPDVTRLSHGAPIPHYEQIQTAVLAWPGEGMDMFASGVDSGLTSPDVQPLHGAMLAPRNRGVPSPVQDAHPLAGTGFDGLGPAIQLLVARRWWRVAPWCL
jgi:hypothetical protein